MNSMENMLMTKIKNAKMMGKKKAKNTLYKNE